MSMQDAFRNARSRKEGEGSPIAEIVDGALVTTGSGLFLPRKDSREVEAIERSGRGFCELGNRWFDYRFLSHFGQAYNLAKDLRNEWKDLVVKAESGKLDDKSDLLRMLAFRNACIRNRDFYRRGIFWQNS